MISTDMNPDELIFSIKPIKGIRLFLLILFKNPT